MKGMVKGLVCIAVLASVAVVEAQTKFPLRVDIDVSAKSSRKSIGAGMDGEAKTEQVQVRVKVRKSSSQPWDNPVSAELYVIGKQIHTGYYGIIDVQKGEFKFSKENDNTFEYTSPMYTLGRTSGNINVGGSYETYLVVISDHNGEVIDTRSGRHIKDKGIEFIRKLGKKTLFDRDGNVIGELENPGKAFKKAIPSATDPGNEY
ncbi:hypothetical protein PDESU_04689 [Pontiella desulfatans]|uniref:Uncharacterized protein n=1 Tax=Pontiella desulfatans TaxID=2750659 RepID=A0A6C2U894_PONDE|nr:hypothetical protein [Pontiella desulfatans]VGO16099.1 hypothetical protein PDESU_04689 [Pontiella desulfatans]